MARTSQGWREYLKELQGWLPSPGSLAYSLLRDMGALEVALEEEQEMRRFYQAQYELHVINHD